ncbi:hypothetical protein EJ05DRAFT_430306, partial [Pseudovirgaria hyperparasitica]
VVRKGMDVKQRDFFGRTALMLAADCGSLEAAYTLIQHDAEVDLRTHDGATALHIAVF